MLCLSLAAIPRACVAPSPTPSCCLVDGSPNYIHSGVHGRARISAAELLRSRISDATTDAGCLGKTHQIKRSSKGCSCCPCPNRPPTSPSCSNLVMVQLSELPYGVARRRFADAVPIGYVSLGVSPDVHGFSAEKEAQQLG